MRCGIVDGRQVIGREILKPGADKADILQPHPAGKVARTVDMSLHDVDADETGMRHGPGQQAYREPERAAEIDIDKRLVRGRRLMAKQPGLERDLSRIEGVKVVAGIDVAGEITISPGRFLCPIRDHLNIHGSACLFSLPVFLFGNGG